MEQIFIDSVKFCFNVTLRTNTERRQVISGGQERKDEVAPSTGGGAARTAKGSVPGENPKESKDGNHTPYKRVTPKVGRNDLCPCGSGKKYKNCCGKNTD